MTIRERSTAEGRSEMIASRSSVERSDKFVILYDRNVRHSMEREGSATMIKRYTRAM